MKLYYSVIPMLMVLFAADASAFRRHGIYVGDGFGSSEQFRNVSSDYTGDKTRMGMPLDMSGAVFATYKYRVNDLFTVGLTAGFDNSYGRVTRRRDWGGGNNPLPVGALGGYHRRSRTIAAEVAINYYSGEEGTIYGFLGGGYTFSNVTINYEDGLNRQYPGILGDASSLSINDSRWAHQVSFIGFRTPGAFAFYAEAGFGYKGLVHVGLTFDVR